MNSWPKVFRICWLLGLYAFLVGCGKGDFQEPYAAVFDPNVLTLNGHAVYSEFDGEGGSMRFADGWSPVHEGVPGTVWESFRWSTESHSDVYFHRPPDGEYDFQAKVYPFTYPTAPQQTIRLELNSRPMGELALEPGWREVHLPVDSSALVDGENHLRILYGYAVRPSEVTDSKDRRKLGVAFDFLALVPRWVKNAKKHLGRQRLSVDEEGPQTLQFGRGAQVNLPVPADRSLRLRFGKVLTPRPACELRVDLLERKGTTTELGRWPVKKIAGREIDFETPAGPAAQVRLSLLDLPGMNCPPGKPARIELPPDFLQARALAAESEVASAEAPPPVFIYMIDTLRADALIGTYADLPVAPRVARFTEESVHYRQVWASSSWTLPSVVSTLTGVYPFRHGVMQGDVKLDETTPSLARLLSDNGYFSLGISQSFVASDRFGVDTGFDRFYLDNHLNSPSLRTQDSRRILKDWLLLEAPLDESAFVYLHTVGPHAPYSPTGKYLRFAEAKPGSQPEGSNRPQGVLGKDLSEKREEIEHNRALYQGEVLYADEQFGRFLDLLKLLELYERSLVVLISDHGEEFAEHGGLDHGRTVWEEMVRVPLYVKYPHGSLAGRRVDERVSTVDLVPTILETAGIEMPDELELHGRSLTAAIDPPPTSTQRVVFTEVNPAAGPSLASVDLSAIAVRNIKCILSQTEADQFHNPMPRLQTFDLRADPSETDPLSEAEPNAIRCQQQLESWNQRAQEADGSPTRQVGDEERAMLRALGYIR